MPGFTKGPALRVPFGRNVFLRSVEDVKTDSRTLAASTVPAVTIDGIAGQKVLQPGTVLAKITSGADSGKVGPFQGGAGVNAVQTVTVASGTTGGTFTLAFEGETTEALAFNIDAATLQEALEDLSAFNTGDVVVTGGPGATAGLVVTFGGQYAAQVVDALVPDSTNLTGGTHTATVAQTTAGAVPGAGGATDGRGDPANIVGLNNTFLPWQLMDRDVEVAVVYECVAVQAWCIELAADGTSVALSDAVADAMRGKKNMNILFKVVSGTDHNIPGV